MLLSLTFLFIKKYELCFSFLPKTFWIFIILGLIIIISEPFTLFGELDETKCHLRPILFSYGFTLHFIPVLYKLIINFPLENCISIWISEKKNIFSSHYLSYSTLFLAYSFSFHPIILIR